MFLEWIFPMNIETLMFNKPSPMKTDEVTSNKIKLLVEKNFDSHKGYKKAAENATSMNLRDYLIDQAEARKEYAFQLEEKLKEYDPQAKVDMDGSIKGSIQRAWIDVKSFFSGMNDKDILEECIKGDRESLEDYQEFLNDSSTASPEIASTLQYQYEQIIKTLDNVSRLENLK